jgi:hypothetical protein
MHAIETVHRSRTPQLAKSVRGGQLVVILVDLLLGGAFVISCGRLDRPFSPTPMVCEFGFDNLKHVQSAATPMVG